jgi:uncharacterized protein
MFFHVILTTECDSQCSYCYGESMLDMEDDFSGVEVDYSLPKRINYPVSQLNEFCKKDPYCVLTFYGGEPLLCINEIKSVMDEISPRAFMMQTNGLRLDKLEPDYLNRFHTILVSVDGDEALTDFYRGRGTYRKVAGNLKLIKKNGFKGELIARMTIMENTDIYKQVRWLIENEESPFSSVHWQLNAGFWKTDFKRRDFKTWSENSYNPGVQKLADFWVGQMKKQGVVTRLYPFLGIAESLLCGERSLLRCGGGWINYAIQTDGSIIPCPTMWGMTAQYLGNIKNANPLRLSRVSFAEPCTVCSSMNLCGGRCFYANTMKRWDTNAYGFVCNTVRNLIEAISRQMPTIDQLIAECKVSFRDFEFIKYNGCEIIP